MFHQLVLMHIVANKVKDRHLLPHLVRLSVHNQLLHNPSNVTRKDPVRAMIQEKTS